jgi:hypothetical protein
LNFLRPKVSLPIINKHKVTQIHHVQEHIQERIHSLDSTQRTQANLIQVEIMTQLVEFVKEQFRT